MKGGDGCTCTVIHIGSVLSTGSFLTRQISSCPSGVSEQQADGPDSVSPGSGRNSGSDTVRGPIPHAAGRSSPYGGWLAQPDRARGTNFVFYARNLYPEILRFLHVMNSVHHTAVKYMGHKAC